MARNQALHFLRKNFPFLLVISGVVIQHLARDYIGNRVFVYLYPLVFIGAILGPMSSSILSICVAALAICYLFLPPLESFKVMAPSDLVGVIVFTLTGFFFNFLVKQQATRLRQQTEETLQQFKTLADSMPQLAWMAMSDGFIFWYNQGWYHYTGTQEKEMEGWGWKSVHHPDHLGEVLARWPESIKTGKTFEMEFPLRSADGKFRWFLTRAVPIKDDKGKILRWFGTNTDIDVLKQAITLRDEFITLASHEFKTPITSLKLQTQIYQRQIDLKNQTGPALDKQADFLQRNLIQVDRLNVLVDELLDVSRIDLGKLHYDFHEVDLTEIARALVERFEPEFRQKNCDIIFRGDKPVMVQGDVYRLEQIIVNLFTNALKYAEGKPVMVSVTELNHCGELRVQDNGIGIGEEFQKKIFERFERGIPHDHIAGLGLGLYIASEMVKVHNGSITVESKLGQGSTFLVKIPLKKVLAAGQDIGVPKLPN